MVRKPHHFRKLVASHAKLVMLLIIGSVASSLIICSLLFEFGYSMYTKGLTALEEDLQATLSWKNVYITPPGILHIKDFYLHKSNNKLTDTATVDSSDSSQKLSSNRLDSQNKVKRLRRIFYTSSLDVRINPIELIKYIFISYNNISAYDQQRLEIVNKKPKKSINYIILKSLKFVQFMDVRGNLILSEDTSIIKFLKDMLFSKQLLPTDAQIILSDVGIYVESSLVTAYTHNFNTNIHLSDQSGIDIKYNGELHLKKFIQDIDLELSGEVASSDFFHHMNMKTDLIHTVINDVFVLSPINIEVDKSQNNIAFNTMFKNTDVSIVGSIINKVLLVDFNVNDARIEDIFVRQENDFYLAMLINDRLIGKGNLTYQIAEKEIQYQINITNKLNEINIIKIDLKGNENYATVNNFLINIDNQYIVAKGDISFFNWGINGDIDFSLGQPMFDVPIVASFNFIDTPFATIGKSHKLIINGRPQLPVTLEYSLLDELFAVTMGHSANPVLAISQKDIEQKHKLEVNIASLPLDIFIDIFDLRYMTILNDSELDGLVVIEFKGTLIDSIEYTISGSNRKRPEDFVYLDGSYSDNKLIIKEGAYYSKLFNDTSGNMQGTVYFSYTGLELHLIDMTIEVRDKMQNSHLYKIFMTPTNKENIYTLNVNENFLMDIEFSSNIIQDDKSTLKKIQLNSNQFVLPFINQVITGDVSIVLDDLKIVELGTHILFSDLSKPEDSVLLVGNFSNNEGTISNLIWKGNGRLFEGLGAVTYRPDHKTIQVEILETPSLDSSPVGKQTIDTIANQSYTVDYNFQYKNINIRAQNAKLGFFTDKISGVVSSDFIINLVSNTLLGTIFQSQIVYNNQKFTIEGDFVLEGFDTQGSLDISNLIIQSNKKEITMKQLMVDNYNTITGDFIFKTINGSNSRELFDGIVFFNMEDNFFNILRDRDNIDIPNFVGSLILEPLFSEEEIIKSRYRYDVEIIHQDGITSIIDDQRDIYIRYDVISDELHGTIGNSNSILNTSVDGLVNLNSINLDIVIQHYNVGEANNEFLQQVSFITLNDMVLKGKLSLRQNVFNPSVYGYINIENYKGYLFFLNKNFVLPSANLLISDNEISLANSILQVDNDRLLVNMQGQLDFLRVESMQVDILSFPNQYFKPKPLYVGGIVINGEIKGKVSLYTEQNITNITGQIILRNALVSNEGTTNKQRKTAAEITMANQGVYKIVTAEINIVTESAVVFAWPTSNFPILRANFGRNQNLFIGFDGEVREFITKGDITFDSGTIYYFNKGFNIDTLMVRFDEFNGIKDPFIELLKASTLERYEDRNYTIQLEGESTLLSELEVNISTTPPLSNEKISNIFGQGILPDTDVASSDTSSMGLLSTIVKLSDPVSNLGVFSQVEAMLQRTLRVDYFSFKTKFVRNLLSYSIHSTNATINNNTLDNTSITGNEVLPYLLDQSSLEIGKYIDIIYLNFAIELDTSALIKRDPLNTNNIYIPVNTSLNVQLPTPFFDLTWSLDPSLFGGENRFVPVNLLSISWQKKF